MEWVVGAVKQFGMHSTGGEREKTLPQSIPRVEVYFLAGRLSRHRRRLLRLVPNIEKVLVRRCGNIAPSFSSGTIQG